MKMANPDNEIFVIWNEIEEINVKLGKRIDDKGAMMKNEFKKVREILETLAGPRPTSTFVQPPATAAGGQPNAGAGARNGAGIIENACLTNITSNPLVEST